MIREPMTLNLLTPSHWDGCTRENIRVDADGLRIDRRGPGCRGILISPPLDCREEETVWHRMGIDADIPDGAGLELTVYSSDSPMLMTTGGAMPLAACIAEETMSAAAKLQAMAPFRRAQQITPRDVLLHAVQGRYVWFALVFTGQQEVSPHVRSARLTFPRQSLVDWLPDVYREQDVKDDFLTRYLAVFGALFEDMDEQIDSVARLLDTDINAEEMLRWMSTWLAVEDAALWREDRLRELMRSAIRLYRIRGTPKSIVDIVGIYTGKEPFLVEAIDTMVLAEEARPSMAQALRRLYGEDPSGFSVLVSEADVPSERSVQELGRILEAFRPAHTKVRLVVLRPYIFLDQHTYLGKNTWLTATRELSLDGFGTLPYVALLHDAQEQEGLHEKGWQDE